ncbi:unnamed protein product [Cuscuta campestris]|uniref:TF-B3 domain-containing protein n=1 Tax=Cuscuta campestris TaxID=132261 RepID=A0A484MSC3_9ASTE|nr:unnamed protein product [Cuscuta campestris]
MVLEKVRSNINNRDFVKMAAAAMPWTPPAAHNRSKRVTPSPEPAVKEEVKKKTIKKRVQNHDFQGQAPADLPEAFRRRIRELAGPDAVVSEERLLIQKALTASDVGKNQSRLTMPVRRMVGSWRGFLREEEEWVLMQREGGRVGSIDGVPLVDPSLRRCGVSLRRWVMRKGRGRRSSVSLVITKKWKEIFTRLRLTEGLVVQVWSCRVNEELWLALVRV